MIVPLLVQVGQKLNLFRRVERLGRIIPLQVQGHLSIFSPAAKAIVSTKARRSAAIIIRAKARRKNR